MSSGDRHERPPYVSFYPSDWKGGTLSLPMSAEWTYFQVCLHNWDKGEPLPPNIQRMTFSRNPDWEGDIDLLIEIGKVVRTQAGGLWSKRAMVEANNAKKAREKRSRAGTKGAKKRWNSNDKDSDAIALPSDNDSNATEKACDANGNQNQNQNQNQSVLSEHIQGDLLDRIDPDIWQAFVEHRIKLKAPMTERAQSNVRKKLIRIYETHGHEPNEVLDQSIESGWKSVFPLKQESNGSGWDWTNEK